MDVRLLCAKDGVSEYKVCLSNLAFVYGLESEGKTEEAKRFHEEVEQCIVRLQKNWFTRESALELGVHIDLNYLRTMKAVADIGLIGKEQVQKELYFYLIRMPSLPSTPSREPGWD